VSHDTSCLVSTHDPNMFTNWSQLRCWVFVHWGAVQPEIQVEPYSISQPWSNIDGSSRK
jgi:hypothetical protein